MRKITAFWRVAIVMAVVLAMVGVAHASLALYTAPGAVYVGHWTWNDEATNTAIVEVRLKAQPPKKPPERAAPRVIIQNFQVEVGATAEDGTFVQRSRVVQVPLGATYEVTLSFDRTLTSLQFIRIKALPRTEVA